MSTLSRLVSIAMIGALAGLPSFAYAQTAKAPAAATTVAPAVKAEPMDINTATKDQLMTLDGIGEARSDAIIKGRPYKAKNELADKKIVPQKVYDTIKDQIVAKQMVAQPAAKTTMPVASTPTKK